MARGPNDGLLLRKCLSNQQSQPLSEASTHQETCFGLTICVLRLQSYIIHLNLSFLITVESLLPQIDRINKITTCKMGQSTLLLSITVLKVKFLKITCLTFCLFVCQDLQLNSASYFWVIIKVYPLRKRYKSSISQT